MDFNSGGEPIFEQLIKRIRQYVEAGVYKKEEKLPSVREFAATMGINPKTVVRAYEALAEEGVLYSLNKKGYYVQGAPKKNKEYYLSEFNEAIRLARGHLTKEEMINAVNEWQEEQK